MKEKKKDIDLFKSFANNEAVHASASSFDRTDRWSSRFDKRAIYFMWHAKCLELNNTVRFIIFPKHV